MFKSVICILLSLLLISGLSACQPIATQPATPQPALRSAPGLTVSVRGASPIHIPDAGETYLVDENMPFVGQFNLQLLHDEAVAFTLTCLLDHLQIPCTPDVPLLQDLTLEPGETLVLRLETPALRRGSHDFSITYWLNPFADHADPLADSRVFFSTYRQRISLIVGENSTPPSIATERLSGQRAYRELDYLYANPQENPFGEYGSIVIETHLHAAPNELVDLYVHLNNRLNIDMDMAVTAFVDYQQVPLFRNGAWQIPLYVAVPTHTWQPVAVQFQAPSEPGLYEFVVVGALFPYARMDALPETDEVIDVTIMRAHSSARILLEVE